MQDGEAQDIAEGASLRQKRDAQEVDGVAVQNGEEQVADDGAIRQKREVQSADDGNAVQNGEVQKAVADDGNGGENTAEQGDQGQYVVASDFGGPIVQILQRVFRSNNCCACGCDCGCPEETSTVNP